ncbi:MAG: HPr family phosphocarrier protein [Thermodesulfobacteriota bacterium]
MLPITEMTAGHNGEHSKELTIVNKLGLHARAAAQLVQLSQTFQAEILLEKAGQPVDAKSVLALLMLECPLGTRVKVRASGVDADEAVTAVARLIENKFGEE